MSKHEEDESESSASESSASESHAESSSSEAEKKPKKDKKKEKKDKKVKKDKKEKGSKKKDKKEKKEKGKGKSGKRGPKGAQWMTWKIPYQENSILGQAFKQASAKGGVDIKKLTVFVKKAKGTPAFVLRQLRKGHSKGWKWETDDSHSRLRITNARIHDKKWSRE